MTVDTQAPVGLNVRGGRANTVVKKIDELDLHSDHVQEVLGVPPHWLVRWGSSVVLAVVLLLVVLSWILHYPDVVPATIVITTPTPPSSVTAQASGSLSYIQVRDNMLVKRGALLAVIENSADPAAVFDLQGWLTAIGNEPEKTALGLEFPDDLLIGELHGDYGAFVRAFKALKFYLRVDPANVEIRNLEPQLARHRERRSLLERQRDILAEQVALAQSDHSRAVPLAAHQNLTLNELNARARLLLQAQQSLQAAKSAIADIDLEIDRLEQTIANLRLRDQQQRYDLLLAFSQSYETMRSHLAVWERSYVLRAPVDGQVSLFRFWSNHQFVRSGEEVLTIVPEGSQLPFGKMLVPVTNSGKIKLDQTVFIRLDNYPFAEYGLLRGFVRSISPVPRGAQYAIEVELLDGLTTSFGRHLEFRQEMQGSAEIVTEDLRLIERIFYQLRALFVGKPKSN
jgi:multidrug resistance efflux pump